MSEMTVGQRWIEDRAGLEPIAWRVTWVGKRKARLHASLAYGWATATVFMDRVLDSPNWRCEGERDE